MDEDSTLPKNAWKMKGKSMQDFQSFALSTTADCRGKEGENQL
jgi:hypothetical protein